MKTFAENITFCGETEVVIFWIFSHHYHFEEVIFSIKNINFILVTQSLNPVKKVQTKLAYRNIITNYILFFYDQSI